MSKRKPLLVAFEGLDGVGKSTYLNLVGTELAKRGYVCGLAKMPNLEREAVRMMFSSSFGEHGLMKNHLSFTGCLINYLEDVECLLGKRELDFILVDRWFHSSFVYQHPLGDEGRALTEGQIQLIQYLAHLEVEKPYVLHFRSKMTDRIFMTFRRTAKGNWHDRWLKDDLDHWSLTHHERMTRLYHEAVERIPHVAKRVVDVNYIDPEKMPEAFKERMEKTTQSLSDELEAYWKNRVSETNKGK